jgi:hypothetical protein
MDFQKRVKWQNDSKTQEIFPLRTYTPGALADLTDIVAEAGKLGYGVRASGSRHSWSDAAVTPDFAPAVLGNPIRQSRRRSKP